MTLSPKQCWIATKVGVGHRVYISWVKRETVSFDHPDLNRK